MKLTKYEQSGFILETDAGFQLAFDIANKTPLERLGGVTVDAMLISHIHGDHFSSKHIKKLSPKTLYLNKECKEALGEEVLPCEVIVVKTGESIEVGGIKVLFFNVEHGPNISAPLLENFGFMIEVEEKKIYFAGDMFYESGVAVTDLEVDYALIPVGTFYTFGPQEAFDFVKKFKKIHKIVPMHYEKTPETKEDFFKLATGIFETR